MFTEILEEKKRKEIIKTFKKEGRGGVYGQIETIVHELALKNNEFDDELVRDKSILRYFKIKKLRKRAQEGHSQLNKFSDCILNDFNSDVKIVAFNRKIIELLNLFEKYVIRLKERETALIEVFASFGSLLVAIIAIIISLCAITR